MWVKCDACRMLLTSAFEARFNWRNAAIVGMLTEELSQAVALRTHVLELVGDPDFITEFTRATCFS